MKHPFCKAYGWAVMAWLWTIAADAEDLTLTFEFQPGQVTYEETVHGARVRLEGGADPEHAPGTPDIPSVFATVRVPSGATVTGVTVRGAETLLRSGLLVAPAQPPQPLSGPANAFVPADPAAYASTARTPAAQGAYAGACTMRGHTLVGIRLNPLRYEPAFGALYLAERLTVTVSYDKPAEPLRAPRRHAAAVEDAIRSVTVNPGLAGAGPALTDGARPERTIAGVEDPVPDDPVDYLIIAPEAWTNTLQALAEHRERFPGLRSRVLSREAITASYPGSDNPMKIRACISNYYVEHGLLYVTLAGDDTVVPARSCIIIAGSDTNYVPTDLYYSALDGSWNDDGDGRWGEVEDGVDMGWEVIVGRLTVRTVEQAADYLAKLIAYETDVPWQDNVNMLLMGKRLFADTYYTGDARPPDDVTADGYPGFRDPAHPSVSDAEVFVRREYRDAIQPFWAPRITHYMFDTLSSWDPTTPGSLPFSATNLVPILSSRHWYYTYMFTHGSAGSWSMNYVNFGSAHAAEVTNLSVLITASSCYFGAFQSAEPNISEAFLRNPNGGALACIGSAAYGWSSSSPYYFDRFTRRLFQTNGVGIGWAFAMHKLDCAPNSQSYGSPRWLQFSHNLQGDAALCLRWQTPPEPPSGVTASKGDPADAVRVNWLPIPGMTPPITAYRLYRSLENDPLTAEWVTETTATTCVDTAASAGQTYYYWVKAWDSELGEGAYSEGDGAANAGGTPPPAPEGLVASTASWWQVELAWNAAPGAGWYEVLRAETPEGPASAVGATNGAGWSDTTVDLLTDYWYWVRGANAYGTGEWSGPVHGRAVKRGQQIAFDPIPDQAASASVALSAAATSGQPVSFRVVSGPGSVEGATLTFSGAGTVAVEASQDGDALWAAAAPVTQACYVGRAAQAPLVVGASGPWSYNTTNALTVTGGSGSGALTWAVASGPGQLVGGDALWVTAGYGTIVVLVEKAGDAHYMPQAVSCTVTAVKAGQRLTWPAMPDQIATSRPAPGAQADSGLPVHYRVVSGPALYDGARLEFTGPGSVTLTASQPGDGNWHPAATTAQTFSVSQAAAQVFLGDLSQAYDGTPRAASAASLPAGLPIELTYNGRTVVPVGAGRYTVVGRVTDRRYDGAATGTLEVAKGIQTIEFPPIPDQVETGRVTLAASASSGLPVTYAVRSGPGVLAGGADVTFTGPGTVVVSARQAGNANWESAPEETRDVRVRAAPSQIVGLTGFDYDGDGVADPGVYDQRTGTWTLQWSASGYARRSLGTAPGGPGWSAAPGDYDGDGLADPAAYRESDGRWRVLRSRSYGAGTDDVILGGPGWSAAPGDYDGDCESDVGVYREESGAWKVGLSGAGGAPVEFNGLLGGPGWSGIPSDYDGDRVSDPAVYQRAGGTWTILLSGSGYAPVTVAGFLGGPGWGPAPGDYDGDGLADPAVRSADGRHWRVRLSGSGYGLMDVPLGL